MKKVIALSSWVATGHVGLSAGVPVLQALGHGVTQLPTVILSNHPGFSHSSGAQVPPDQLGQMIEALDANGWLGMHDSLLTGYLPTTGHVDLACRLAERMRQHNPAIRIVTDPVLGDSHTGLYIAQWSAAALRDRLAALADTLTPNAFELGWLTGLPVGTIAQAVTAARRLMASGKATRILVTSPPMAPGETGVLEVTTDSAALYRHPMHANVPQGTGDAFSAMIAAGIGVDQALGHLDTLVEASVGAPHLRIAETASSWTLAAPVGPSLLEEQVEAISHGL